MVMTFILDVVLDLETQGHSHLIPHVEIAYKIYIIGAIGVRANIHLGGQTEFCPNGENNLFVTRPRQGEKIIMNYCTACF